MSLVCRPSLICSRFQSLQVQQDLEIERLEKHLEQMKFEHENTLRSMRSRFLRQRQAFEDEYEARKKAMSDSANLVSLCLGCHVVISITVKPL